MQRGRGEQRGRRLAAVAAVALGVVGLWRLGGWVLGDGDARGAEHLTNQIWVDHFPADDRDMFAHFLIVAHPDGKIGVTGRSSLWRHRVELFEWARSGDTLHLRFPQSGSEGKVSARTWRCEGEAPEPFELCLELRSGQRAMLLYSREEWVVKPQGPGEALVAELPALAGLPLPPAPTPGAEPLVFDDAAIPLADPAALLR